MTTSHIVATTPTVAASPATTPTGASHYRIIVATEPAEIRSAQRLRYRVFADEMGARLHTPEPGLDIDEFDEHCDHLVVRDDRTGQTVGTYRMLPPTRTPGRSPQRPGRLYSDSEFDLAALSPLRDVMVETGRSCVDPEHRNGAVINLMWTGIARYLHLRGYRWLAGCASVPIGTGRAVDAVWQTVRAKHLAPPRLRVTPRNPYRLTDTAAISRSETLAAVPPLLRGYLRLGAWICGEPAHDTDFDVADFFVLLSLDRIDPRYLNHFLGPDRS